MEDYEKRFIRARSQMLIRYPFFGALALKKRVVFNDDVGTACASKDGQMYFSPKFIKRITDEELTFLVAHEVMHLVFAHAMRKGQRDPMGWNIACDAVINGMLAQAGMKIIDGAVRIPGAENKSAEQVYAELPQEQKDGSGGGAPAVLDVSGTNDPGKSQGSGEPTKSEIDAAIAEGKMEIAAAMATARASGKGVGSAGLQGILDKLFETKVDWRAVLDEFFSDKANRHQTWKRPNKRYCGRLYMPTHERLPSIGEVVIGVDMSGSVSEKDINSFLGHINGIFEQCHPTKVYVMCTTHVVEKVLEFEPDDLPIRKLPRYCGGTDMTEILAKIDTMGIDPSVCCIITDGFTPYPSHEPEYPLLWVLTEKGGYHNGVGRVVFIEKEQ